MENQPKWVYVAVIIALLIAAAGYFYWQAKQEAGPKTAEEELSPPAKASQPAVSGTLPSIGSEAEVNVPEVNPIDKANPFKDVYQNPFE